MLTRGREAGKPRLGQQAGGLPCPSSHHHLQLCTGRHRLFGCGYLAVRSSSFLLALFLPQHTGRVDMVIGFIEMAGMGWLSSSHRLPLPWPGRQACPSSLVSDGMPSCPSKKEFTWRLVCPSSCRLPPSAHRDTHACGLPALPHCSYRSRPFFIYIEEMNAWEASGGSCCLPQVG